MQAILTRKKLENHLENLREWGISERFKAYFWGSLQAQASARCAPRRFKVLAVVKTCGYPERLTTLSRVSTAIAKLTPLPLPWTGIKSFVRILSPRKRNGYFAPAPQWLERWIVACTLRFLHCQGCGGGGWIMEVSGRFSLLLGCRPRNLNCWRCMQR